MTATSGPRRAPSPVPWRAASALAAFVLHGHALAQDLAPLAVEVGEDRLLCFCIADDSSGKRVERLHVAALDGDAPALEFLRARCNTSVLTRLDRTRLLLASYGNPYALVVVDLAAGKVRELAPGAPHEFVAMHGDDVLHVGDARVGRHFLFASPWREPGEPRQLCRALLDRVEQVSGNLALAVAGRGDEAWVVSLAEAKGRRLFTVPDGGTDLRLRLSPSGGLVAIGCRRENGDGALYVVDGATGALRRSWVELPIALSRFSSSTPTVEVGWADDDVVVCSETRAAAGGFGGAFVHVRRSVTTGKVLGEDVYSGLGLDHCEPPRPGATEPPPPLFEITHGSDPIRLLRAGSEQPLATKPGGLLMHEDLCVSPDGRFATARLETDGARRLVLFRPDLEASRTLAAGWAHSLRWLPAAK